MHRLFAPCFFTLSSWEDSPGRRELTANLCRGTLLHHDLWLLPHPRGARSCPSALLPQESPCPGLTSQCLFFLCRSHVSLLRREFPPHRAPLPTSQREVGFTLTASSKSTQSTIPRKRCCPPRGQGEEGDPQSAIRTSWGDSPTPPALSSTTGVKLSRADGGKQPGQQIAFQPRFHPQQVILLT